MVSTATAKGRDVLLFLGKLSCHGHVVPVSHPMFCFDFWKYTMLPWLLFSQDEGVVGPSGATGRALAGCLPAHPTPSALPCSALMEDFRQVFHLQGTSHLLPR